jgi:hypothetical protein
VSRPRGLAPDIGQHTAEVLEAAALTPGEVSALAAAGIVGPPSLDESDEELISAGPAPRPVGVAPGDVEAGDGAAGDGDAGHGRWAGHSPSTTSG